MQKYIQSISGNITNTDKFVDIKLNGKNLIITGCNGSGKTLFLREAYKKTCLLISEKKQADLPSIEKRIQSYKDIINRLAKGTSEHENMTNAVNKQEEQLNAIKKGIQINIPENIEFSENTDNHSAVIMFFQATRAAKIKHADTARGLETEKEEHSKKNSTENIGSNLEQHLVNLKNRQSLAITEEKNLDLAEKINSWISEFENNLKFLMEDDSTKLIFDSSHLKFSIKQDGKLPYTFQTLSSGYSAIFDIYADLLLRTRYFDVSPEELGGVVFIDEIDAHLHVSLQRLIFPFFEKSFPSIQFIITTHSPFVITSVDNATIFDIGKNSQIDEDLSLYSYTAVMEGLLGTKTTSKLLDETISQLSVLVSTNNPDLNKLKTLIAKIHPLENKLDAESKAFYLRGINYILDKEQE